MDTEPNIPDVKLSSGRIAVHQYRQKGNVIDVIATPGDEEMTEEEWIEYNGKCLQIRQPKKLTWEQIKKREALKPSSAL